MSFAQKLAERGLLKVDKDSGGDSVDLLLDIWHKVMKHYNTYIPFAQFCNIPMLNIQAMLERISADEVKEKEFMKKIMGKK